MKLVKAERAGWYVFECERHQKDYPKGAGFWWNTRACPYKWATKELEVAHAVREHADPELRAELEAAMQQRAEAVQASKATDAELQVPAPEGLEYLPFQRAGIAYALERDATLIGDEMGLGKTIQALGIVNGTKPGTVLVICPASLRLNWLREAQKWLVDRRTFWVVDSKQAVPEIADFVIVNYDRLDVRGLDRDWDLLIVDEAHKVKNPKAKRTKRVLGVPARGSNPRMAGLVDRARRRVFLTGTPVLNRPVELFPLLSALDPEGLGRNFFSFAKRYCGAMQGPYGWDFSGATNLKELQRRLREKIMVRRLKQEVLTELPAKRRQLVALAPNGAEGAVNEEAEAWERVNAAVEEAQAARDLAWAAGDLAGYKEAVEELKKAARVAFTEMSRQRHRVALAKVPAFVDYAKDALEATEKVVVFAHHHDVIDQIMEGLRDFNPARITGQDGNEARDTAVHDFQNDPTCRVIVGSIGAMGVGLTLTASSTVLFAELDWVPANVTQAEDRCHRIGQVDSVTVVHVVLDGSLDQRMAEVLVQKQEIADLALDRGTDQLVDLEARAPALPEAVMNRKPRKDPEYKPETKAKVLQALQQLAGVCDGAVDRDGQGFSKFDARIGHSLAEQNGLSDRQTWLGLKLCRKYRRQLQGFEELLAEQEVAA